MYMPHFMVTQTEYDQATPEERKRYNYVVVDDEPMPLPAHICCGLGSERESAESRISAVSGGIFRNTTSINQD